MTRNVRVAVTLAVCAAVFVAAAGCGVDPKALSEARVFDLTQTPDAFAEQFDKTAGDYRLVLLLSPA